MPTKSFKYLDKNLIYLDQACQTLRPKKVIETELKYYTHLNSCGGRGNHQMVRQVNEVMHETRKQILHFIGKSSNKYTVVFCPNTTIGINILLTNLNWQNYKQIVTTDKEHNSVYLPAISFAKKFNKQLRILLRSQQKSLDPIALSKISNSVCLFNTTSNIDGESLNELDISIKTLKNEGNLVLLDATQSLAHNKIDFFDLDFDCLFASGHKIYAPSIGFMVIKKSLIKDLDQFWVGGGTVQKVENQNYELIEVESDLGTRLEFGLQDYAAIFGLSEALEWLSEYKIKEEYPKIDYDSSLVKSVGNKLLGIGPAEESIFYIEALADLLFDNLQNMQKKNKIKLLNKKASSIISFVAIGLDSYSLTARLSEQNIICRSGFMCCHSYIKDVLKMPAVTRVSIGLHNTPEDIITFLKTLNKILS